MYRRKLGHSRVKNLYKFSSYKNNDIMTVESFLEFNTCFHLEYDEKITSFCAQPEGYHYHYESKELPYTPDFKIMNVDGRSSVLEVKPSRKLQNCELLKRLIARKEAAKRLGYEFILVTENQVNASPKLFNLKLFHRYACFKEYEYMFDDILRLVKNNNLTDVSSIAEKIHADNVGVVFASVVSLLASGQVKADIENEKLNYKSPLWLGVNNGK